jgi:flavin reductase (DIM6/NTAB) family NADH-FMN oxidoreductase RutF/uncharacterized protein YciI
VDAASGAPNVAPKIWLQLASFEPPILLFSGQPDGTTEANARAAGCFSVNIVHAALAERVFGCVRWRGARRIERAGFTLVPASTIAAPLVQECRAHLECELVEARPMGGALLLFGRIVAASADGALLDGAHRARYARLDQVLFLEDGLYAAVDHAHPAAPACEGGKVSEHDVRWVYLLSQERPELFSEALVREHVAHLKRLEDDGLLELCGPFPEHAGGMVILRGCDEARARAIAEADPFVSSGAERYELRRWELSRRSIRHMGMG